MKAMVIFILLAGLSSGGICQDAKMQAALDTVSKAEFFSRRSGSLIEKQFLPVGQIKGIKVEVLKTKDLITGEVWTALRFEYEDKKTYTSETRIAALDLDEIDGMLKSVRALLQEVYYTTREVYTEIDFRSRTGFVCAGFYETNKSEWIVLVKVGRNCSSIYMTKEEMAKFIGLVEVGQKKM